MKLNKVIKLKKLRLKRISLIVILLFLSATFSFSQKIDSKKSLVKFEIDGIGWSTVEGEIRGMKGSLLFNENNLALSFFNVCIDPTTIFTDDEKRDNHLKDPDFFDTEKYKTICIKSSEIVKSNNGYRLKGKLTILNTTKPIEFDFTVTSKNGVRILKGEFEVNRFDFGLAAESYSSSLMVGKKAKVAIHCVLID
ncbi:MAG: protein yceI precursor [Crocinitomicaceae bacterium]|nr:protein yceI precursor [Crocinitomicaceae bacterium]|tara:strand:- start:3280 stop:3864 length:585 start_codon:yes stop_codon:yes gene_type:complete